jgi:hypothetical protein
MKSRFLNRAARAAGLGIILTGTSLGVQAATVVFYDFDAADGSYLNAVDTMAPELVAASSWVTENGGLPVRASGLSSSNAPETLWSNTQFMAFTFTIAPGFKLDLNGLSFSERFGGVGNQTGPKQAFTGWNLIVNGVEATSGPAVLDQDNTALGINNVDSFRAAVLDTPLLMTGLTGSVEVRFTGDNPFTPAGAWRFDNFNLSGEFSPVPVPGAVWLFGSAIAGLVGLRRRVA